MKVEDESVAALGEACSKVQASTEASPSTSRSESRNHLDDVASLATNPLDSPDPRKVDAASPESGSIVSHQRSGGSHASRRTSSVGSMGDRTPLNFSNPEASGLAIASAPYADPCEAPHAPLPNRKLAPTASTSKRASVSHSAKKSSRDAAEPATNVAAVVKEDQDDSTSAVATGGCAVVRKWQRHRAARETQSAPMADQKSVPEASADGPLADSLQSMPASDSGHFAALSLQGGSANTPARERNVAATGWRPSLRLRK
jgi:hypothetical protein